MISDIDSSDHYLPDIVPPTATEKDMVIDLMDNTTFAVLQVRATTSGRNMLSHSEQMEHPHQNSRHKKIVMISPFAELTRGDPKSHVKVRAREANPAMAVAIECSVEEVGLDTSLRRRIVATSCSQRIAAAHPSSSLA